MTQDVYFMGVDDTQYYHERVRFSDNPYLHLTRSDIIHTDNGTYEYLYKEYGDRGQTIICRVKPYYKDKEEEGGKNEKQSASSFTIQGNSDWVQTPFYLRTGTQYTFIITGSIEYDNKGHFSSPEGLSWSSDGDPYPHLPHCCLLGKVGKDGAVFNLGELNTIAFTVSGDDYLCLSINDTWKDGNVGSYTITRH